MDFEKGFLKVMDFLDEDMPPSTKRSAPEGTPDRESQARASTKVPPSQMMPQVLVPEVCDPVSKVEMSAATIAALRNGMGDMETRLSGKIDAALHGRKQKLNGNLKPDDNWRKGCVNWRNNPVRPRCTAMLTMKWTNQWW